MKNKYKPSIPQDVEAKVSIPTDEVIKEAAELAYNEIVELGVFKERIEVLPSHKNQQGHCRIDSAEGCYKYFQKRFKKFIVK